MTHHVAASIPLGQVSERLAQEVQTVMEDVLELQHIFLSEMIGGTHRAEDIKLAQKFDFVEQSLCDLRRLIHNMPDSVAPFVQITEKSGHASTADLATQITPDASPSAFAFLPPKLTEGLKLGRIRALFQSQQDTEESDPDDIDWL